MAKGKKTKEDAILIRVTNEEKAAFQLAADLAGISVSSWVRERLRQEARRDLMEANIPVPFLEIRSLNNG